MSEEEDKYSHVFFTELISIKLEPISTEGRILDIGGGGEATISQLEDERCVAIDLSQGELDSIKKRVPSLNSLMLTMDARELQFIDHSFEIATCFFSLMYMTKDDQVKAFSELFRVLKTGGKVLIWDLVIPEKPSDSEKTVYAVRLDITLPNTQIGTGFGIKWNRSQEMSQVIDIAKNSGFIVDSSEHFADGECFKIFLSKP